MTVKKFIRFLAFMFIFVFLCSYFALNGGYYEYHLSYQKKLTENQMKQFEKDVQNGKDVDINDYLKNSRVDYSNSLTNKTSEINIKLNEYLKKVIGDTFKILEKLVK